VTFQLAIKLQVSEYTTQRAQERNKQQQLQEERSKEEMRSRKLANEEAKKFAERVSVYQTLPYDLVYGLKTVLQFLKGAPIRLLCNPSTISSLFQPLSSPTISTLHYNKISTELYTDSTICTTSIFLLPCEFVHTEFPLFFVLLGLQGIGGKTELTKAEVARGKQQEESNREGT